MSQIRYALFFSVSFLLFSPSIMRVRIDETRAERFVVLTEGLITNVPYLGIYGVPSQGHDGADSCSALRYESRY